MRTLLFTSALVLSLALSACGGGGGSTTTPQNPPSGPAAEERVAAVVEATDAVSAELEAEISVAPMMSFERDRPTLEDWDSCTTYSGTFQNGQLVYNECPSPRGTLNGTVDWSFTLGDGWTTTRDLVFRRGNNGMELNVDGTATWKLSLKLDGSRSLRRQGATTTSRPGTRVESASDLRWEWTRTQTGVTRTWPIGTASIDIFHGNGNPNNLVHEIDLIFDGTATVVAIINGEEYTVSLIGTGGPQFRKYR